MKEEKLSFLQKLKFSIFNFEKYQDLAAEKIKNTIIYLLILVLILGFTVAGINTYKFTIIINNVKEYIDSNIEEINFNGKNLNIILKDNKKTDELLYENTGIKIIINTNEDDESVKQSINDIELEDNGILILKDKVCIKNQILTSLYEYTYNDISEQYNINNLDKQETIKLLSLENLKPIILQIFIVLFIYFFIILYLPTTLIDIFILSVFAYIVSLIAKIRLKYSAIYNIATYSITLSIILNIIYIIINGITGFSIKYFDIMYTAIASIYISTAILMIRSDFIKKQMQLTRIIEEQDKIRMELERKEEEKKEKAERERQKREDEEKNKKKEKQNGNLGEEPEGENG